MKQEMLEEYHKIRDELVKQCKKKRQKPELQVQLDSMPNIATPE